MAKRERYFGLFSSREAIIAELAGAIYGDSERIRAEWLAENPLFPTEREILFAVYDYENYSGDAFLLFERDGKLYAYEGSHCSCNGLEEENFSAQETSWEALYMRDPNGLLYGEGHSQEAREAIKSLVEKRIKRKALA